MISFSTIYKMRPVLRKDPRRDCTPLPIWMAHTLHSCLSTYLCCHSCSGSVSMKTATCPIVFASSERKVNLQQRNMLFLPLAFSLCEFPLKFNIAAQNLGSKSGDLVHGFGPLMGKLFHFCANVSSLLKRFSKTLDGYWKVEDTQSKWCLMETSTIHSQHLLVWVESPFPPLKNSVLI